MRNSAQSSVLHSSMMYYFVLSAVYFLIEHPILNVRCDTFNKYTQISNKPIIGTFSIRFSPEKLCYASYCGYNNCKIKASISVCSPWKVQ